MIRPLLLALALALPMTARAQTDPLAAPPAVGLPDDLAPEVPVPTARPAVRAPLPGAEPTIRVRLLATRSDVTLTALGSARLLDGAGALLETVQPGERIAVGRAPSGLRVTVGSGAGRTVAAEQVRLVPTGDPAQSRTAAVSGGEYRGTLTVERGTDGVRLVNEVPLEQYLRAVVPAEIGRFRDDKLTAAAAAQAVAARSYALVRLASGGDLSAGVADQVYRGAGLETPITDRAVELTRGQVIRSNGQILAGFFHAVCGGQTEAVQAVWSGGRPDPALVRTSDNLTGDGDFCRAAPTYRWTETYTREQLESILRRTLSDPALKLGVAPPEPGARLRDLYVTERTPSGRVGTLRVVMGERTYLVHGDAVRRVLLRPGGREILRSSLIRLELTRDENDWITQIQILGGGSGHGIGLCQVGATEMSRRGFTHPQILSAYYRGAELVTAYGGADPDTLSNP